MKKTLILGLALLCLLLPALEAKSKKQKQLDGNLRQWEQFRWLGIIQVESSLFSMRKNFVLAKDRDELRMDILDSGVLGLQAKPLVSVYVKDRIVLEAPTIKQLSKLDPNWFIPGGAVGSLIHFTDSLQARSAEILANRTTEIADAVFGFDKKFRLNRIANDDLVLEARILYNRRGKPTRMLISHAGTKLAELQINKQEYGKVVIKPLKPAEDVIVPDESDENDFPKELDLEGLKLHGLKLGDLELYVFADTLKADSLLFSSKELKSLLDSLDLKKLDLEELKLGALLDSLDLKGLDLQGLLDSLDLRQLDLDSLDLGGLLDSLNWQDLKLDGLKLEELDLEELLRDLDLQELNLEELLQGLKLEDLKLEDLQLNDFDRRI